VDGLRERHSFHLDAKLLNDLRPLFQIGFQEVLEFFWAVANIYSVSC
jgi:hypothetical protein